MPATAADGDTTYTATGSAEERAAECGSGGRWR